MQVGDLVCDSSYGMIGIIVVEGWAGIDNQIYDFGILYEDGHTFGGDERELEVISESR